MKFSTRTLYGLQAVLVLADRFGERSLSVSQIARREAISVAYLEQILNALKKRGLVKSLRGPQGGYVLSRKPGEITLKDLLDVLEAREPDQAGGLRITPDTEASKIANLIFWKKFRASLDEGLGQTTLKDLLDEARALKKTRSGHVYTFHI